MQWRDFPLPDGSYSDDCRPFTQQDVCNYLPTFAEATGTRSRAKYVPVPGMPTFAGVGDGPHRGIRDVEGKLFVVSGNTLYQVATDGTATSRGTIPGTRRVSMVHNQIDGGNELIIATGDNSYVWNTVTETLTATGVPLLFVDFLNQLIIGIDVARRFWRWSGLADATSWNSLDNESAESSPDRLVGHIVSQGEVLLFGERTIEVWPNSPSGNLTFQRSTVIEKGCANGNTICRLDNTVYFVGNDSIAYRLQGYTPVPISSKAITDSISDGDPSKLFAFTWEDKGYVVYYLTAQDGNTWGFDVTCQKWHRRESFGLTRWRVNTLCKWNGDWYAGDYSNGKLYRLTWGNVYEGCDIMPRSLRTGVMHNNGNRMFVSALKLLVNTGREPSVASDAPTITGDLPDGVVGDVVDFQYTVTPAYPGQTVTLTLAGALPTGLAMDAGGHVTGTLTTTGTFSWTITPSSDCGDGAALADGATIGQYMWVMARANSEAMYLATDPVNGPWTATTRNNGVIGEYLVGATGTERYIVYGGTTAPRAWYSTDLDATGGIATTQVPLSYFGGFFFADADTVVITRTNNNGYDLSVNGGLSVTANAPPLGTLKVNGVARLSNGRWLCGFGNGASAAGVAYTDDAVPSAAANWISGSGFGSTTSSTGPTIVSNGTVALALFEAGQVYRTTDGAVWSLVFTATSGNTDRRCGYADGDLFLLPYGQTGQYLRTDDAGLTFAEKSIGVADAITRIDAGGGYLVASTSTKGPYHSSDLAQTFAALSLPFTLGTNEGVGCAAVLELP